MKKTVTPVPRALLAAVVFALAAVAAPSAGIAAEAIKIGVITDRVGGAKFWATAIGQGIEFVKGRCLRNV